MEKLIMLGAALALWWGAFETDAGVLIRRVEIKDWIAMSDQELTELYREMDSAHRGFTASVLFGMDGKPVWSRATAIHEAVRKLTIARCTYLTATGRQWKTGWNTSLGGDFKCPTTVANKASEQ